MLDHLRQLLSRSKTQARYASVKLRGEALEERCVPTRYKWVNSVFDNTNHWTDRRNWEKHDAGTWTSTVGADDYPGGAGRTDDEAEFFINSITRDMQCVMNVPITLKNLKVQEAFSSYIELQHPLTINNELWFDAHDAIITTDSALQQVRLTGTGTKFKWYSGTLFRLQVIVGAGATLELPARDPASGNMNPYLLMAGTNIDVEGGGTIEWRWRNVRAAIALGHNVVEAANLIHIHPGATFNIFTSGRTWGSTDHGNLEVRNRGNLTVLDSYGATIIGRLNNQDAGYVLVAGGTLEVTGPVVQSGAAATFKIAADASLYPHNTAGVLDIWNGTLTGGGKVEGSVCIYDGFLDPSGPAGIPGGGHATLTITCILHMYGGTLVSDVYTPSNYDKVFVGGNAILGGSAIVRFVGVLNQDFNPGARIVFLRTTGTRAQDKLEGTFNPVTRPTGWSPDKSDKEYWLRQGGGVGGIAALDADGDGVFEPGNGEPLLAGVTVVLRDEDDEVVATQFTAADGSYLFDEVGFGTWTVEFTRPPDLRPVQGGDEFYEYSDSDYDYATLTAPITLDETSPFSDPYTDALFRPLIARADTYYTNFRTAVGGNVLDNDPPAAGDTLIVTLLTDTTHGDLTLNDDGTFTYLPDNGFYGAADTFTYRVTDSYGHTADAVVTITVATPPMAQVTGYVWRDLNGNGINDYYTEYGVYNVTVQLLDDSGAVVAEVLTGNGSVYVVFNVLPGTYRVRVLLPEGYDFTAPGGDSDVDEDGYSGFFTVAGGEYINVDAGMIPPGSPPPSPPPPPPPTSPPPPPPPPPPGGPPPPSPPPPPPGGPPPPPLP